MAADGRVQPDLAHDFAVKPDPVHAAARPRVVEDRVLGADAGVIADEEDAIDAVLNTFDHRKWPRGAGVEPGAGIEFFDEHVQIVPVPVADDHFIRTGIERAANGGVDIPGHQAAEAIVFGVARVGLVAVHHARDAFHVGCDENFHG